MQNKSVSSLVNSAANVTLPAFAAERRAAAPLLLGAGAPPLSIDMSCRRGTQQQTRRTPQRLLNDGTDQRTQSDKWTDQWRSRTFGRSGRWSNLLPFRLRFWKLESLFNV